MRCTSSLLIKLPNDNGLLKTWKGIVLNNLEIYPRPSISLPLRGLFSWSQKANFFLFSWFQQDVTISHFFNWHSSYNDNLQTSDKKKKYIDLMFKVGYKWWLFLQTHHSNTKSLSLSRETTLNTRCDKSQRKFEEIAHKLLIFFSDISQRSPFLRYICSRQTCRIFV